MPQEKSPDFSMMAKIVMMRGKKTGNALVVMPFHNRYDYLDKHLDLLKKQTLRAFDLLIVGSSGSDEKRIVKMVLDKNPDFPVTVVKRFEDNGAAGGFYTGERFALENGYERMIMAEEDALPVDSRLIELLIGESERGAAVVSPTCSFILEPDSAGCARTPVARAGSVVFQSAGVHFYTLIKTSVLLKSGLHFIPIYLGAEDREFSGRIPRAKVISASVTHPARLSIFTNFEKNVGYRVNHTIFTCREDLVHYFYSFGVLLPAYFTFGVPVAKAAGMHILSSLFSMKYGKQAVFTKGSMEIRENNGFDRVITPIEMANSPSPSFIYRNNDGIGRIFHFVPTIFRKKVLLYPVKNYVIVLSMVFAKETWISTAVGCYVLAENRNPVVHGLKILVFPVISLSMLIIGLIMWPMIVLRRPKTRGFGTPADNKK